jgi:predicted secreted protein
MKRSISKNIRGVVVKKYFYFSIVVLLVMGLLVGCSSSGGATYTDPSKTVEVANGQQFTIVLDGNYTTGFQWEASFDQAYLKMVSQEYKPNESKPGMVGVPGKQYYVLLALKKGATKVTCTYKRSFETAPGEQKIFNVNIK